jgi:YgiT-type zinc finger domain-containing protein
MTTSAAFEWGACPCGGKFENRMIEVRMTVDGKPVVMTDVPQGVCPNCGSRVYRAEMLERIECGMKRVAFDRRLNRMVM